MSREEPRHYFTANGRRSSDYGVYISGASGLHSSPARSYEHMQIPGRNGDFLRSYGFNRLENLDCAYKCFIADDYPANVSGLREWLTAQEGYIRLEDSLFPDEYLQAVFEDGLDPDGIGAGGQRAGTFEIRFNRMPQRFLKSGEKVSEKYMPCGHVRIISPSGAADTNDAWLSSTDITLDPADYYVELVAKLTGGATWSDMRSYTSGYNTYLIRFCNGHLPVGTLTDADVVNAFAANDGVISLDTLAGNYSDVNNYQLSLKKVTGVEYYIRYGIDQRYMETLRMVDDTILLNPTQCEAKPIFHVYTQQIDGITSSVPAAEFSVNGAHHFNVSRDITYITAGDRKYSHIYLDCETENAWFAAGSWPDMRSLVISENLHVTVNDSAGNPAPDFPTLRPGLNSIRYEAQSGLYFRDFSFVEVMPRWWRV